MSFDDLLDILDNSRFCTKLDTISLHTSIFSCLLTSLKYFCQDKTGLTFLYVSVACLRVRVDIISLLSFEPAKLFIFAQNFHLLTKQLQSLGPLICFGIQFEFSGLALILSELVEGNALWYTSVCKTLKTWTCTV